MITFKSFSHELLSLKAFILFRNQESRWSHVATERCLSIYAAEPWRNRIEAFKSTPQFRSTDILEICASDNRFCDKRQPKSSFNFLLANRDFESTSLSDCCVSCVIYDQKAIKLNKWAAAKAQSCVIIKLWRHETPSRLRNCGFEWV